MRDRWQLGGVPTWALEAELVRRGEAPAAEKAIRLPGLVVAPTENTVIWRGEDHAIGGRAMEVIYALAILHQRGFASGSARRIATTVWRGFSEGDALQNLRCTLWMLRRDFPGLVISDHVGTRHATHRLALDPPAVEAVA